MKYRPSIRGLLAAILVLAAVAVCVRLGFWQLDRHAQRQALNTAVEASLASPAVNLDAALAAELGRTPEDAAHRRLRVRGEYLSGSELLWRGRSRDGSPGVHLLAPLRIDGSSHVLLVDRGWIPSPDGNHIDSVPRRLSGRVEIEGIARPFPTGRIQANPVRVPAGKDSLLTVGRLDPVLLREVVDASLLGFYVQELPTAGVRTPPIPAASPAPGEGPHLGYAVQWFGFAAVFLVGLIVVAVRRQG